MLGVSIVQVRWKKVSRELNLDLVAVQDVRWDKGEVSQQTIIHFSMEMGMLVIA